MGSRDVMGKQSYAGTGTMVGPKKKDLLRRFVG